MMKHNVALATDEFFHISELITKSFTNCVEADNFSKFIDEMLSLLTSYYSTYENAQYSFEGSEAWQDAMETELPPPFKSVLEAYNWYTHMMFEALLTDKKEGFETNLTIIKRAMEMNFRHLDGK